MNKLLILCGLVMLGNTATSEKEQIAEQQVEVVLKHYAFSSTSLEKEIEVKVDPFNRKPEFIATVDSNYEVLNLNELNYVDLSEEDEVNLGFNTADYLPEGFNPYEVYFDINSVEFIDTEESEVALNTSAYLPENFNPYTAIVDVAGINYIEEDELEPVDLGFNTAQYLPAGFSPYKVYFDIHSITYIEDDELEEIDLGFDTAKYLPEGFNPYAVDDIK